MGTPYATVADWDIFGEVPVATGTVPAGVEPPLSQAISDAEKKRYLQAASDKASSQIGLRYSLPITGWGDDLREAVCAMAIALALDIRGYNADGGQDKRIQDRAIDRWNWLKSIGSGSARLVGVVDQTPDVEDFIGVVVGPRRTGWVYRPDCSLDANGNPIPWPHGILYGGWGD